MFDSFDLIEKIFLGVAVAGSFGFLLAFVAQLFGADADVDAAGAVSAGAQEGLLDSDVGFKLLSFLGLTCFSAMFGWVGLAAYRSSGLSVEISLGLGLVAGYGSFRLIQKVFSLFKKLESSGKAASKSKRRD